MGKLVCVFAHPDDESMGPGGTIAKYAKNHEVYLICVTNGNGQDSPDNGKLGAIRQKELQKAAKILGVKKLTCLGFNDGELNNNLYHKLAAKIEEKLLAYRPDTLLTFDISGVTGHIDHIAVSLVTSYLFKKLEFIKTLLYYGEMEEMLKAFAENYFIYTPPGFSESEINLKVDISDVFEIKKQAILAHQSQRKDGERIIYLHQKFNRTFEPFIKIEK